MLLVISTEDDISTDYFMEWCQYLGGDALRINEANGINMVSDIVISKQRVNINFSVNGKCVSLDEVSRVWFRRGYIRHFSPIQFSEKVTILSRHSLGNYYDNENTTLNNFVVHALKSKVHVNDQNNYNSNKLIVLDMASKLGLNIPHTLVTNNIGRVTEEFHDTRNDLITKSLQDAITIQHLGYELSPEVHSVDIEKISKTFSLIYYSKFQKRINKKIELRIFFLGESYYAAAIFSKKSLNGKYAENGFIRHVPYTLPGTILEKLIELNRRLDLKSGSIDMIIDEHNDYYFLEVNPVGQYDYISKNCNYNLDKKIAEYFSKT